MSKRGLPEVAAAAGDGGDEVTELLTHPLKKKQKGFRERVEGEVAEGGGVKNVDDRETEARKGDDAKTIGAVIKVSGKGMSKRKHYKSFKFDGNVFELGDTILLCPEHMEQKPSIASIKDITQDADGSMMVTGQLFYRPEDARKKDGGNWPARDIREIFYTFHLDEVPADSVMHNCVVHFVPLHKQLPVRSEHPGFIVQRVYDIVQRKLWEITDNNYEDNKQHEITLLIQQTQQRLGELPDIEPENASAYKGDQLKSLKRVLPIDLPRGYRSTKSYQPKKAEKHGSYMSDVRNNHALLGKFKALTGDPLRDKWLDKLLQGLQQVCNVLTENREKVSAILSNPKTPGNDGGVAAMGSKDKGSNAGKIWETNDIIPVIAELEMVTYEALGLEFQKYNQKMRQLDFNLKTNPLLASRLLEKELDPVALLAMNPKELKDGSMADTRTTDEPEKLQHIQMTDARCSRCMEKNVGVSDIIQAAGVGHRYQLECLSCGYNWFSSRDDIHSLADKPSEFKDVEEKPK